MRNMIKINLKKEIQSYFLGFLFSIILTVLPFLLVVQKIFSSETNFIIILFCAVSQIIIHFLFFLHLNIDTQEGLWNVIILLFVMIIIFILISGSIWIMFNLNHHMLY